MIRVDVTDLIPRTSALDTASDARIPDARATGITVGDDVTPVALDALRFLWIADSTPWTIFVTNTLSAVVTAPCIGVTKPPISTRKIRTACGGFFATPLGCDTE